MNKKYRLAITTVSGRRWVSDYILSEEAREDFRNSMYKRERLSFVGVFPLVFNGEVTFFNASNVEAIEFLDD